MYNVLIVDDDPIICTGLQRLIPWEEYGYAAGDYALNGLEALARVERGAYDLVITDIRMPKLDGIGLIRELRERQYPAEFIVLSGYKEFEYAQRAMEYGVRKYILKPVNQAILVNTLLELRRDMQEREKQRQALDESKEILRDQVLRDLLRGAGRDTAFAGTAGRVGIELGNNLVFRVLVAANSKHGPTAGNASGIIMKKAADGILGRYSAGYAVCMEDRVAVILSSSGEHPVDAAAIGQEFLDYVNKFPDMDVNISIGNAVSEYENIGGSFRNAWEMHGGSYFDGKRHMGSFDDIPSEKTMESILRYVRENCSERLTLQSISGRFFFNPAYMGRVFKTHTGRKFNDYLIDCRMEKAVKLMECSKYKVADIARRVGYTDYDHFCKVFKLKMGCTPSEYKAENKV